MNDRCDKRASLPGHDGAVPVPIILYTDGGCTGNEQLDASQRVMRAVVSGANGTILVHLTRSGGSNNIAELWAVALALRWAKDNGHTAVEIRTDSTNTLAWVEGRIGRKMYCPMISSDASCAERLSSTAAGRATSSLLSFSWRANLSS